ncbi:MAG: ferrous iron transport protein B [Planctomycetota bacterium]
METPTSSITPPTTDPVTPSRLSTLAECKPGQRCSVISIAGDDIQRRRLLEMGFTTDTPVEVVRRAPMGDPVEYRLRDYSISLRRIQAERIQVMIQDQPPLPAVQDLPAPPTEMAEPGGLPATLALLGNPNSGKTSVFNALTGLRQKVANYSGVTVEKKTGVCQLPEGALSVIDLPGAYSLSPTSPDERVARAVIACEQPDMPQPEAVLAVLDASCLARHLLVLTQLMDYELPCVVALNKMDLAEARGLHIDCEALARRLGCPVVPCAAARGRGMQELRAAIPQARVPHARAWQVPQVLTEATDELAAQLPELLPDLRPAHRRVAAERLICRADRVIRYAHNGDERLPVAVDRARHHVMEAGIDPIRADVEARYEWIDAAVAQVLSHSDPQRQERPTLTDRLDRLLVHPLVGLGSFAAIMGLVFYTIFVLADPLMGACEEGVMALGAWLADSMAPGPLKDLLLDGVIAGVGGVLVFVPQIAILFGLLSILENSGYLARAAFLMDRVLCKVGLHGKSFIPMLSSHACAIPGVMAARSIEDKHDRLITMLVAPFMSCAARLPVYFLIIHTLFGHWSAMGRSLLMLSLYLGGIAAAAGTALLARRTLLRSASPNFLLEFPPYARPQLMSVLRSMWTNAGIFVRKAGTVILAFSILLWAALTYPRLGDEAQQEIASAHGISEQSLSQETIAPERLEAYENALSAAQMRQSAAGRLGQAIEPVIAPLGYDWKIGVGLIGAFAAREVFVSTMGIVYSAGEADEGSEPLQAAILGDVRPDGTPMWTTPVALGLLAWFVIAMQCIRTVAIMRRETGGWRWPLAQLAYMNGLAWIVAFAIFQIGSRL